MKGKYITRNIQLAMLAGKKPDPDLQHNCENQGVCSQTCNCTLTKQGKATDKDTWLVFSVPDNE